MGHLQSTSFHVDHQQSTSFPVRHESRPNYSGNGNKETIYISVSSLFPQSPDVHLAPVVNASAIPPCPPDEVVINSSGGHVASTECDFLDSVQLDFSNSQSRDRIRSASDFKHPIVDVCKTYNRSGAVGPQFNSPDSAAFNPNRDDRMEIIPAKVSDKECRPDAGLNNAAMEDLTMPPPPSEFLSGNNCAVPDRSACEAFPVNTITEAPSAFDAVKDDIKQAISRTLMRPKQPPPSPPKRSDSSSDEPLTSPPNRSNSSSDDSAGKPAEIDRISICQQPQQQGQQQQQQQQQQQGQQQQTLFQTETVSVRIKSLSTANFSEMLKENGRQHKMASPPQPPRRGCSIQRKSSVQSLNECGLSEYNSDSGEGREVSSSSSFFERKWVSETGKIAVPAGS